MRFKNLFEHGADHLDYRGVFVRNRKDSLNRPFGYLAFASFNGAIRLL